MSLRQYEKASQFPSGEAAGSIAPFVPGITDRLPLPSTTSGPFDTELSTATRAPFTPSHVGCDAELASSTDRPPAAGTNQMLGVLPLILVYAMELPSGDQAGDTSLLAELVSRRGLPP